MDFNFFPSHKFSIIYPELFVASKTGKYSLFELVTKTPLFSHGANTAFKNYIRGLLYYFSK